MKTIQSNGNLTLTFLSDGYGTGDSDSARSMFFGGARVSDSDDAVDVAGDHIAVFQGFAHYNKSMALCLPAVALVLSQTLTQPFTCRHVKYIST